MAPTWLKCETQIIPSKKYTLCIQSFTSFIYFASSYLKPDTLFYSSNLLKSNIL